MSLFGDLKSDDLEEAEDRLGGRQVFESDVYSGNIKMAYMGASAGGARFVHIIAALGAREYGETIYITNKQGKNFFMSKPASPADTPKKMPLPGFTTIDDICLLATGLPLAEQDGEEKVVKIYDFEQKKELPKTVPVITSLLGKPISLGILKVLENKNVKQGDEYVPTAETRTLNTIDKVFHTETKRTVSEIKAGKAEGEFWGAWQERNKGKERDKRTIKDGEGGAPQSGRPGASRGPAGGPPAAANAAAAGARRSLFGVKPAA